MIFKKGGGNHRIDFVDYSIKKNSIHFVAPGQAHLLSRKPRCEGILLTFSKSFIDSTLNGSLDVNQLPYFRHSNDQILHLSSSQFAEFYQLAKKVYAEFKSTSPTSVYIIKSYLRIILIKAVLLVNDSASSLLGQGRYEEVFSRFQSLIENNFRMQKQVNWYAKEICISPGHLNKISKMLTGKNATNHIKERVLIESKRLLSLTDLSQKQIANQIGFGDIFYFNRFFKTNEGLTPGQFRLKPL